MQRPLALPTVQLSTCKTVVVVVIVVVVPALDFAPWLAVFTDSLMLITLCGYGI